MHKALNTSQYVGIKKLVEIMFCTKKVLTCDVISTYMQ